MISSSGVNLIVSQKDSIRSKVNGEEEVEDDEEEDVLVEEEFVVVDVVEVL